jgi:hypothetical protein
VFTKRKELVAKDGIEPPTQGFSAAKKQFLMIP